VGEGGWCRQLDSTHEGSFRGFLLLCGIVRGSFQETAPRKTAENTVKHRDGGVGSVVANQRAVGKRLVVITTQVTTIIIIYILEKNSNQSLINCQITQNNA